MIRLGGLVSQKAFGKFEMGKVISNPFATSFIKEGEGEDHEVSMANNSIDIIIKMATELKAKMGEDEKQIPAWIQDHIAKAENLISQASGNYHEYGDSNESVNEDVNFRDGKYRFYSKQGVGYLTYDGKVLSHGDFDWEDGSNSYWMSHSSWGGQKAFDTGKEIIKYFKSKKITTESINELKKLPSGNFSIKVGYPTFADYEKKAKVGDTILKYDKRGGMIKNFVDGSELNQNAEKYLDKVNNITNGVVYLSKKGMKGVAQVPDYEKKEVGVLVLEAKSVNEAPAKLKQTISKKEWSKIPKYNKHIGMDGVHYIMKYDDKIGTYLQGVQIVDESIKEASPCWKGYKQVGMKDKGGRQVPNCVPNESVVNEAPNTGERIQNLNNRIKVLRDKISATKSPEQKKLFSDRLKNALQSLSNIKKDHSIKAPHRESVVKEAVAPKDMDKIKSAVEAASSFMGVGSELKKLGMKYTFATEPLAIYIVQPTPNNKVAIVNKRYVSKPDFVVGDIAVGVMEGVNEISSKTPKIFVKTAAVEKKIKELMDDRKKAVVPYNSEKDPKKKEILKQILIKLTKQIQGYEKNLVQLRDMEEEYLQQMHADAELDTTGL